MKKRRNAVLALALALCACPYMIQAADWLPTASGTYSWNNPANWSNGTLPTDSTSAEFNSAHPVESGGRQIITGDGVAAGINLITAYPVTDSAVRRFTGNLSAISLSSRTGTN